MKVLVVQIFFLLITVTGFTQDSLYRVNKVKSLLQKDCSGGDESGSCSATYTEFDREARIVYDHFLRMGSASRYIYNGDTVYSLWDGGEDGVDTNTVEISKNGELVMIIQYQSKDTVRYSSVTSKKGDEVISYSISDDSKSKGRWLYDDKKRVTRYEDFDYDKKSDSYVLTSVTYWVYQDKEGKEISYRMEGIKLTEISIKIKTGNKTENYKWYYDTPGEINYPHNGNIFTSRSYSITDKNGRITEELDFKFDPCWLPENYYVTKYTYLPNGLTESSVTTLESGKQVYTTSYEYSFFE